MPEQAVDMTGKVCVVTGANSGIGKSTAEGLARLGATVVMVCRNEEAGRAALSDIEQLSGSTNLELMLCDLASFDSIHSFCDSFREKYDRLDVLVNNAAVITQYPEKTADGYESQFAVNYLAPFLLTNLLLDLLKSTPSARVVSVASVLHKGAHIHFDDLEFKQAYAPMDAYGQSKLGNVLFTYALARRLEGSDVTANCLHPGVVRSGIARHGNLFFRVLFKIASPFMISPTSGAETSIYAATAPEMEGVTGKYLVKSQIRSSSGESNDEAIGERLWQISMAMTGLTE